MCIDTLVKDWLELLLSYMEIYLKLQSVLTNSSVYISEILWNDLIEEELSKCCIDNTCNFLALELTGSSYMDLGVKCNSTILICKYCLILGLKISSLSDLAFLFHCQIVDTKYHIL